MNYYEFIAAQLTAARERAKISTSQLARRVGVQYNTVKGIEQGRPFSAQQLNWIEPFVGISTTKKYQEYLNQGNTGDKEIQEKTIKLSCFI